MVWKSAKPAQHAFRDVAQELTDRIAVMIESSGKVPWKREWDPSKCAGPQAPVNAFTGGFYHGVNSLMFGLDPRAIITGDPRWATFKQAADQHCHIKKGAKSVLGIFYRPLEIEDEKVEDGKRTVQFLKTFYGFHASEIEGLPPYKPPTEDEAPWTRPEAITIIMQNCGVKFTTGGDRAFYSPALDLIQLPPDVAFSGPQYFSATAHSRN
jgi:antirestriction protein ArdC